MVDKVFYGRVLIKKASAFLYFRQNGIVKNLLHHLKYKNQQEVGVFLGNWYGETLKEQGLADSIDVVVPVPLHRKKLKKRGYNQVDKFAKCLAHHLNAEFKPDALYKTANVKTQTKKSRILRWAQTQELYEVQKTESLIGKNVLLVDDVITTGATMEACILALNKVADISVYVTAMAIVPKMGH